MRRWGLVAVVLAACGARTPLDGATSSSDLAPSECAGPAPTCIVPGSFCEPATTVAAICDGARMHRCPAGSRIYERAPATATTCRPFARTKGLDRLGSWGLGSLARVPTDDGRCLWVADSATLEDGSTARNVAFEADRDAPFGTCPEESVTPPTPIVSRDGDANDDLSIQINGGYRLGGRTHVVYRVFRAAPAAAFGVVLLGGGIAPLDPTTGKIVIASPLGPYPWGLDLDLGDAILDAGDGAHVYLWGCGLPGGLLKSACRLARVDELDRVELFGHASDFIASTRATDGPSVFEAARWMSAVTRTPGASGAAACRHMYIAAFGRELLEDRAPAPTGPWKPWPSLGACDLPAGDPSAFCAGVVAHVELADPTRPEEIPLAYGVGTLGTPAPGPNAYWTRLEWR